MKPLPIEGSCIGKITLFPVIGERQRMNGLENVQDVVGVSLWHTYDCDADVDGWYVSHGSWGGVQATIAEAVRE